MFSVLLDTSYKIINASLFLHLAGTTTRAQAHAHNAMMGIGSMVGSVLSGVILTALVSGNKNAQHVRVVTHWVDRDVFQHVFRW